MKRRLGLVTGGERLKADKVRDAVQEAVGAAATIEAVRHESGAPGICLRTAVTGSARYLFGVSDDEEDCFVGAVDWARRQISESRDAGQEADRS